MQRRASHTAERRNFAVARTASSQYALPKATLHLAPQRRELLKLLMADPPMSYDEISARLGIPKGSIGPTRARILEQLRTQLSIKGLATPC